ncbi:MAG: hypothetical protein ACRETQ_07500 [Gammaproteobacteria bacterium]
MRIAWTDSEWHILNSWLIPTLYVFRHGKLVKQWSGWPAGAIKTLRKNLADLGVIDY